MDKSDDYISCNIFQKQESVIKDITSKINAVAAVEEKAVFAEILRKEVDVLLSCQDFKEKSLECEKCRFIGNLRKRTADIIIKVKKLK